MSALLTPKFTSILTTLLTAIGMALSTGLSGIIESQWANAQASSQSTITTTNNDAASSHFFDAKQIAKTNSISSVSEPAVKNLVIVIPDSIGRTAGQSSSIWPYTFLPASATITAGTTIVWLNADVNATHSIAVKNAATGQTVFTSSGSIPYQNSTSFRFQNPGQYTFTDPPSSSLNAVKASSIPSGTIQVVKRTTNSNVAVPPSIIPNSTNPDAAIGPTVGLFAIPATGEAQFDQRIGGQLGFTIVSKTTVVVSDTQTTTPTSNTAATGGTSAATSSTSANITTGNKGGTVTLYVWNQNAKSILTLEKRLATKVRVIESIIYPGHATK